MDSGMYLRNAEFERCNRDKKPVDLIFGYTSLHYILEGYGYFQGVRLGPGQFFCAEKGKHVRYYPDPEQPWAYGYFDLCGEDAKPMLAQLGIDPEQPWGTYCCAQELLLFLRMYKQYTQNYIGQDGFFQSAGALLLWLHSAKPITKDEESAAHRHVLQIKGYLDSHFYQRITMEEVAKQFYLSRPYIRNLFVRYLQISPKQYLQKVRMEQAAELLDMGNRNIALVAASVGYEDALAFSRLFKQYHGVSPLQYHREGKKKNPYKMSENPCEHYLLSGSGGV